MLALVHPVDVDPKEGIWQPAWHGRIGQIDVDDESREGAQEDIPSCTPYLASIQVVRRRRLTPFATTIVRV